MSSKSGWEPNAKLITVYFKDCDVSKSEVDADNYHKVLVVPKAEFSSLAQECLNEVVKWTHAPAWVDTGKRFIKSDDVIFIGHDMYTLSSDLYHDDSITLPCTSKVVAIKQGSSKDD